jgi:hypothetical protein
MFGLDDKFLQDLGLDQLPEDQRQAFKEHIYSELELRVGVRLSEGLSDEQLAEFESFVDRDQAKVQAWVMTYAPQYASDSVYAQLYNQNEQNKSQGRPAMADGELLAEYASLKWLAMNRPNYRDVVTQVLEELKREISSNRDAILGNDDMPQAV